ncbi:MAG: hypothetical protein ACQEXM_26085 [Actinomycetota bacterium]
MARIVARRVKVDDPDRWKLPDDPDNPQVREVLDYLQRHTRVPRWVLQADVADALTLNNYLWWADRRRELAWLKAGVARNLFLSQLGAQVGIGKQGVKDRIDRLDALLQFDRPDEQITREARRAARAAEARRDTETAWVEDRAGELAAIAAGFTTAADRFALADDDREWIDELGSDARDGAFTPASMTVLSLAAEELRTAPAIVSLDGSRPYQLHGWLQRADELRAAFSGLGTSAGTGAGTGAGAGAAEHPRAGGARTPSRPPGPRPRPHAPDL